MISETKQIVNNELMHSFQRFDQKEMED